MEYLSNDAPMTKLGAVIIGAIVSIPLLGDLLWAIFILTGLGPKALVKSKNLSADIAILVGLFCAVFFTLALGGALDSLWLPVVLRFLIASIGTLWFMARLDGTPANA